MTSTRSVLGSGATIIPIEVAGQTGSRALGLNEAGAVSGSAYFPGQGVRAFRWIPSGAPNAMTGTIAPLGTLKNFSGYSGRGINAANEVTGDARPGSSAMPHALLWTAAGSASLIGPSGATYQTEGLAINDAGQCAVWDPRNSAGNQVALSMIVGGKRKLVGIGPGYPRDLNASGQVISYIGNASLDRYLWTPSAPNGSSGSFSYFPDDFYPWGLNDAAEIAGAQNYELVIGSQTYSPRRAVLSLPAAAHGLPAGVNLLPWPPPPTSGTWVSSFAFKVSNSGAVIGSAEAHDLTVAGPPYPLTVRTIWVWDPVNGTRDLTSLVAGTGWVLDEALDINSAGQIVGNGRLNDVPHGFLLKLAP